MFNLYPYLFTNIITIVILTAVSKKFLSSEKNDLVILSGLTNLPCFIFTVLFEGAYWTPIRLGGWVLGVEDILCAYALAALACFATVLGVSSIQREQSSFNMILKRYLIIAGCSGIVFFPVYLSGLDIMTSFIIMCVVVGLALFIFMGRLRRYALAGIWKLPLLYLPIVKIYFAIWPEFIWQWNTASLWGKLFLGIPIGEISWAFCFGLYWPLFIGYVFGLKEPS